jgi:uncharacterized protein
MFKLGRFFLLVMLFSVAFVSISFIASAYYNPGNSAGFVNDYAEMMSTDQKQALEKKLSQFEKDSSNEIAVVTINNLQGDTIENFAVKLFEDWKIGKEKNDNGVLVLVSKEDRKMRIEVGYGLEPSLTDAISSQIINGTMKPSFQAGDYYSGIDGAVEKIISVTKGEYTPSKNSSGSSSGKMSRFFDFFWIFMFVPIWLPSVLSRSYGRKGCWCFGTGSGPNQPSLHGCNL